MLQVEKVRTDEQVADIGTEATDVPRLIMHVKEIKLIDLWGMGWKLPGVPTRALTTLNPVTRSGAIRTCDDADAASRVSGISQATSCCSW